MEAAGLAFGVLPVAVFIYKGNEVLKEIKNAPEKVCNKQKEVAEYSRKLAQVITSLGREANEVKHLLFSSRKYQHALNELAELLKPFSPSDGEASASKWRKGIKATVKADDIKKAVDKVLREQDLWMRELPLHILSQVRDYSTATIKNQAEISKRQIRAEAVGTETHAAAGRIESNLAVTKESIEDVKIALLKHEDLTAQTQEDVKYLKLAIRDLRLLNEAAVEKTQKVTVSLTNTGHATEDTTPALAAHKIELKARRSRHPEKDCACIPLVTRRAMWQDRYVEESFEEHSRDCHNYDSGHKKWSYCAFLPSWTCSLLVGRKSVTIGWTQSSGAGAFSVGPILRMTRQVKREVSPVFRQLDKFYASFPWASWVGTVQLPSINKPVGEAENLEASVATIKSLFRSGQGFPTDVDENGQSIWQTSLKMLEAAFRGHHDELIPDLTDLLLTLLEKGVKPGQEYHSSGCITLKSVWNMPIGDVSHEFYNGKTTAFDGFRLPLYDELEAAGYVESHAKFDSIFEKTPPVAWRPLLRVHPELLDDYGLTPIAEKLLLTSTIDEFKKSVTYEDIRDWDRKNDWRHKRVLLGWPEVVPYLAQAGCDLSPALEDACTNNCVEIVRALLSVEYLPVRAVHLDKGIKSGDMLEAIVRELVARRDMMCELASAVLKEDVRVMFGLVDSNRAPSAADACRLLEITLAEFQDGLAKALRDLEISSSYFSVDYKFRDPEADERRMIERLSCIELFDKYVFPDAACWKYRGYPSAIQCLLDAGFHGLDKPDENGETTLYRTCHNYKPEGAELGVDDHDLLWLLKHSTKDRFPSELVSEHQSLVSPIFYAASILRHISIEDLQDARVLEPLPELPTDDCECFCSSGGCMPHYMFLRCDGNGCQEGAQHDACTGDAYGVTGQDGCLHKWCEAWALPAQQKEIYYAEACRLEIFERLGMKHTCCASGRRKDYIKRIQGLESLRAMLEASKAGLPFAPGADVPYRWPRLEAAEQQEIQEEDGELKAQLDCVMQHYTKIRALFLASPVCGEPGDDFCDSFWFLWWTCVDRILPPLGKEKCVYRGLEFNERHFHRDFGLYEEMDKQFAEKRRQEEKAALTAAGYRDEDFGKVVDEYFVQFLDAVLFFCIVREPIRQSATFENLD